MNNICEINQGYIDDLIYLGNLADKYGLKDELITIIEAYNDATNESKKITKPWIIN